MTAFSRKRLNRRTFLKLSGLAACSAAWASCGRATTVTPTLILPGTVAPTAVRSATHTVTPSPTLSSIPTTTPGPIASPSSTASPTLVVTPTPPPPPRNIVWITVDATRTDHVSAYGYARPTTPNLDAWVANQGVRFQNAITTAPWTFPANGAMVTGRMPLSQGLDWEHTNLPKDAHTLAEYLKDAGYYTAGFVSAGFVRGDRGFKRGFDLYNDQLGRGHPNSYPGLARELNTLMLNWLKTSSVPGNQPLFLYLYYYDPHSWYNPLPPYDTLYDPDYTGTLTAKAYGDAQDVVAGKLKLEPRDVEYIRAMYDGEITFWDAYLGEVFSELDVKGLLDETLVVVAADHGDMFGEHNQWLHGGALYHDVLNVPLILRYPGVISAGQVVDAPVYNMDIMPTILEWAGLPIPEDLHAKSLVRLIHGASDWQYDIFSELTGVTDPNHFAYWITPRSNIYAVQRDQWKLIHHPETPDIDELYQLNAVAPYETENQLAAQPELADELRAAIHQYYGLATTARKRWFSLSGW